MEVGNVSVNAPSNDNSKFTWVTSVTDKHRHIIVVVVEMFLCGLVSQFGIIANLINMIVFYRQGLNTTINISLFAMAVSDLSCVMLQLWYIICAVPVFVDSGLPLVFSDFQYYTGGIPHQACSKITCLITVYITAERCLCITFPLKIKQIITLQRTTFVIVSIYISPLIFGIPLYSTAYIDWKFYPGRNRSLLGLSFTPTKGRIEKLVYSFHAISLVASVAAVVVFTSILIRKLRQKAAWRKTANAHAKVSETFSDKDRTTMSMVVLIASILIVCYTPGVISSLITFCEPQFSMGGRFYNMYYILWSFAFLLETANSSVNIFLYLKMSTKYRRTFYNLFLKTQQTIS